MVKMILMDNFKLELYLFFLISLLAYSAGLRTNNIDDLHNQLNDNQQQKRASGFVPMRGRKSDETNEFSNSNVERTNQLNSGNEKEILNEWDVFKTLNNFFKSNQNANLEEQLNLFDQQYPSNMLSNSQTMNNGHRIEQPFRRLQPMFNSRILGSNQQITPFLGIMSRYGSPKRAGFVPMRGRKSDPNVLLINDDEDDYLPFSYKRAGFLPMRGKKQSIDLDDLVDQYNQYSQKRAFHALRG